MALFFRFIFKIFLIPTILIGCEISESDKLYNQGLKLAKEGQYDQAITYFNEAIAISPRDAEAYNNRGNSYHEKGQYDEAISDYNKAIEISPRDADVYKNRGNSYQGKGQYDRAISDYNKAIEIDPRDASAYNNRGFTYMVKLGNKNKACSDWKRACELGSCKNYELAKRNGDCK